MLPPFRTDLIADVNIQAAAASGRPTDGGINEMPNVGADALGGPAVPIELPMLTDTRGVEGAAPYKR